jgi:hypothetical protein
MPLGEDALMVVGNSQNGGGYVPLSYWLVESELPEFHLFLHPFRSEPVALPLPLQEEHFEVKIEGLEPGLEMEVVLPVLAEVALRHEGEESPLEVQGLGLESHPHESPAEVEWG